MFFLNICISTILNIIKQVNNILGSIRPYPSATVGPELVNVEQCNNWIRLPKSSLSCLNSSSLGEGRLYSLPTLPPRKP